MSQTFYIEADEEIISVIGRLRKSSAEENVFVFPKRALVLQSIVNLKLFQREAQKLGKKIVVVSQDEVGRMLAEKAGIETENYSEDFSQKAAHLELSHTPTPVSRPAVTDHPAATGLRADTIGSSDFHGGAIPAATMPLAKPETTVSRVAEMKTLRVRNASPERPPSLNSKRFDEISVPNKVMVPSKGTPSQPLPSVQSAFSKQKAPAPMSQPATQIGRDERLRNFYSGNRTPANRLEEKDEPQRMPVQPAVSVAGKNAHAIFFIIGGISIFSVVGVLLFLFLPKADVHLTPYKTAQTMDLEFAGRISDTISGNDVIAVRVVEQEKEIIVTVPTTGTSSNASQKAHGTVVIYNNFSTDPQPLVATTRLETADGKLFRLVSGVTVPGMTTVGGKKEPGAIEAEVIADQSGETYNIEPSTFTIPGFKSGPKYNAFSAKSSKAMLGGGSGGGSEVTVVAKVDIDTAEREAREKVKTSFLEEMVGSLTADEKILDEHMDIVPIGGAVPLQIGTIASSFEYKNSFRVRAFVFSEKKVRENIENATEKAMSGIRWKTLSSNITYGDSIPNFSEGTIRLRAHALVTLESAIDRDALRKALVGKDEDGIAEALQTFPEVKKISVDFYPQWFIRSIPDDEDRVTILIEPGEEAE